MPSSTVASAKRRSTAPTSVAARRTLAHLSCERCKLTSVSRRDRARPIAPQFGLGGVEAVFLESRSAGMVVGMCANAVGCWG